MKRKEQEKRARILSFYWEAQDHSRMISPPFPQVHSRPRWISLHISLAHISSAASGGEPVKAREDSSVLRHNDLRKEGEESRRKKSNKWWCLNYLLQLLMLIDDFLIVFFFPQSLRSHSPFFHSSLQIKNGLWGEQTTHRARKEDGCALIAGLQARKGARVCVCAEEIMAPGGSCLQLSSLSLSQSQSLNLNLNLSISISISQSQSPLPPFSFSLSLFSSLFLSLFLPDPSRSTSHRW